MSELTISIVRIERPLPGGGKYEATILPPPGEPVSPDDDTTPPNIAGTSGPSVVAVNLIEAGRKTHDLVAGGMFAAMLWAKTNETPPRDAWLIVAGIRVEDCS